MEYVKPECRSAEKGGRVTLKDIAREANVSHTVVSHILSSKAEKLRVSPATQKRVMDIARRLNYRPSFAGRGLVSRKTLQIGLFTPFGNFNAMPRILSSVQEVCTQHDYAILHFSYAGGEAEKQCIDRCLYRDVDGIIAVPYFENPDRNNIDLYRQLRDQGIPLVEVCGNYITDVPAVRPDGRKGCRLSLEHLYELGHREAALFTHHRYRAFAGGYAHPDAEEQYKCCVDICERLGMRFEAVTHQLPDRSEKELPYFAERFYASAERAALEWLSRSHRPKAVVCYNEFQALAMVNAAHQAGIRVPEQLSVISFDSLDISGYSSPPLTAIRQNFDQLGREAAKRLFDRMDDGTSAICEVLIPPELIVRKSTAPCQK